MPSAECWMWALVIVFGVVVWFFSLVGCALELAEGHVLWKQRLSTFWLFLNLLGLVGFLTFALAMALCGGSG
ncbi:MAG: hypothetical protein ACXADS_16640 [Candidatus Thorarchaeota archaeon]